MDVANLQKANEVRMQIEEMKNLIRACKDSDGNQLRSIEYALRSKEYKFSDEINAFSKMIQANALLRIEELKKQAEGL